MRTGICTTDLQTMPAEKLFKKLSGLGTPVTQLSFASIAEVCFVPDGNIEIPATVDKKVLQLIRRYAQKYHIEIAVINGTFNMAHPNNAVRAEGLLRFESLTQAVKSIGCGMISLCSGTRNPGSLWAPHGDNQTMEAWRDMFETVSAAVEIAERFDIVLAVETETANIIDTPEKARKLMDEIGSPNLKMIMDCANLFHAGEAHTEYVHRIMCHAFELFGRDVVIAHGKDIKQSSGIEFCGTGEGIVDFKYFVKLLAAYDYQGDMFLHGVEEDKLPAAIQCFKDKAANAYSSL